MALTLMSRKKWKLLILKATVSLDSDSNAVSVFLYGKHTSLLENGTIKGGGDGVSSEAKPSPDAAAVGFSFFLTMRQSCT